MAKSKGRTFLVKVEDSGTPGTFNAFCGLTAKSLKINNERVDVTTPDCTTPGGTLWRETLDGVKSVSISGDGLLVDQAQESDLIALAMSTAATGKFEVVIPTVGTFAGTFSVEVEYAADGSVTFNMSLESTGEVTFTAAA